MVCPERRLPPAILAALIQLAALLAAYGIRQLAHFPAAWFVPLQSLLAFLLAHRSGLAWWWRLILPCFVPLLLAAQSLAIAPGWYLFAFFLLLLLCYGAARDRVPLYLSGPRTIRVLLSLLPRREGLRVLDLGAGWGSVLAPLARARPDGVFAGVENAPISYGIGRLRLAGLANVRLYYGDIWRHDLGNYEVVYAFLSPAVMERLWRKARHEMRSGSVLISNTFPVPGVPADGVVEISDLRGTCLYLWNF